MYEARVKWSNYNLWVPHVLDIGHQTIGHQTRFVKTIEFPNQKRFTGRLIQIDFALGKVRFKLVERRLHYKHAMQ